MVVRILHIWKLSLIIEVYNVHGPKTIAKRGYIPVSASLSQFYIHFNFIQFYSIWILLSLCRLSPSQQITCSNIVGTSSVNTSLSNLSACGSSKNQESPVSKWTCSVCTFVNSVKNSRCAQCTIKRESESDPSSHVSEQINALSIKDVDAELTAAVNNRTSPLRSNSLSGSRGNLGAAGNRISPVDNKCYSATKWPCSVCIIQNI